MKRIFTIIFILLTLVVLVACNGTDEGLGSTAGELSVVENTFAGNTYNYLLDFNKTLETEAEILEVAYTAGSKIYDSLRDEIGLNKRVLIITLQSNGSEVATLTWTINNSVQSPGLTLIKEILKN